MVVMEDVVPNQDPLPDLGCPYSKLADDHTKGAVVWAELQAITKLAGPIIASCFFQVLMGVVDSIIVGHLGQTELAAAALANMWFNCMWYFCFGFLSATDTLAAQAFGAGKPGEVAACAWRGMLVAAVLMCFMACGLLYSEALVRWAMGVDADLAALVGVFSWNLIPGLWPYAFFTVLQKYLQATNDMGVPMLISAVANLFNLVMGYALVYHTPLRFRGSPLATSLSRVFMAASLAGYLLHQGHHKRGLACSVARVFSARQCAAFLMLGLPSALMSSLEAWAFDITTLMAGLLHNTAALSAHSVALNLSGMVYFSLPFGVGIACTIRIGNLLGAGSGEEARLSFLLAMLIGCGSMVVAALCFVAFARHIGRIWSGDELVVHDVARLMPILAIYQVLDGFQGIASGAMRGMGWQTSAAVLNFIGFWVVGVPAGYFLCFESGLGLAGIWWGTCLGLLVLSAGDAFFLARSANWAELAQDVNARLRAMTMTPPASQPARERKGSITFAPHECRMVSRPSFHLDEPAAPPVCFRSSDALVVHPLAIHVSSPDGVRARASGDWLLGLLCIVCVAIVWTFATVLKQIIFQDLGFDQPFYLAYICNSCYMLDLPFFFIGRAGGCLAAGAPDGDDGGGGGRRGDAMDIRRAAKLGAAIAPIWFLAQWTYGLGVSMTTVTSSTIISASTCAWTYLLSVVFLGEKVECIRVWGLLCCVLGNVVTLGDQRATIRFNAEDINGDEFCLVSAILYSVYTTIIRRWIKKDVPIAIFFGALGCTIFLGLLPAAYGQRERIQGSLTAQIFALLIFNGVFDNVLSQYLWAKAVLLTSSTVATVGLSLTIPFAIFADSIKLVPITLWQWVAASLVIAGFFLVNVGTNASSSSNPAVATEQ